MSIPHLGNIRAERNAASIAADVLEDLAVIQDCLIGYFHADAGNVVKDAELGAADDVASSPNGSAILTASVCSRPCARSASRRRS